MRTTKTRGITTFYCMCTHVTPARHVPLPYYAKKKLLSGFGEDEKTCCLMNPCISLDLVCAWANFHLLLLHNLRKLVRLCSRRGSRTAVRQDLPI
jgi:hypothetical protein